jgi:hypothetical protein
MFFISWRLARRLSSGASDISVVKICSYLRRLEQDSTLGKKLAEILLLESTIQFHGYSSIALLVAEGLGLLSFCECMEILVVGYCELLRQLLQGVQHTCVGALPELVKALSTVLWRSPCSSDGPNHIAWRPTHWFVLYLSYLSGASSLGGIYAVWYGLAGCC